MAKKFAWLGNESFENDEIVAPEVVEVPSETVEAKLQEVEGLDHEIETMISDGEEMDDDLDAQEETIATLEDSLEDGGVDETAAKLAEAGMERFAAKYGYSRVKVGAESFSNPSTRKVATEGLIADGKAAISKQWAAFIKWIKDLIAKGKDKWLGWNNVGKSQVKRADKLQAQINNADLGALKDKEEFKVSLVSGWGKACTINDDLDIIECIDLAKNCESKVYQPSLKAVVQMTESAVQTLKSKDEGREQRVEALVKSTGIRAKVLNKAAKLVTNSPKGSVSGVALPGNNYLVTYTAEISGMDVEIVDFLALNMAAESRVFTPLTPTQLSEAASALKVLGTKMEAEAKAFRAAEERASALVKAAEDAQTALDKAEGDARTNLQKALRQAKRNILNSEQMKRSVTTTTKYLGNGLEGAIKASMAAYKKAA